MPAREAGLVEDEERLRYGIEALERLEPWNARVSVTELAALLRVVEVLPERLGAIRREAERLETAQPLVTLHGVRTPVRANRARRPRGAARLFLCMQGPQRAAGVDAILDL